MIQRKTPPGKHSRRQDLHEHTEEEEELADAFRLGRATTASSVAA